MPYLGNTPSTSFATVVKDSFSGDGSETAFTLSKVATTNSVSVFVENVRQEPTTAYAVSGTTLTFTAAPPNASNNIYVLHMNPTTTTTHPASQALTATTGTFTSTVDVNGNELILDADADTSITADTDDQIDIKVGGTDTVVVTPDVLEVKGSHPDLKLLDSDDNNYGGVFYNDGTLTIGSDHGSQHSSSKARISVDGTARLTIDDGGDIDVETGDIFFSTAGKGINLGVTSNTDSNTLDDYEEGTFTFGSNANVGFVSNSNVGKYTKIGNMVHLQYHIDLSSVSGTNHFYMSSMPFAGGDHTSNTANGSSTGTVMLYNVNTHDSGYQFNSYIGYNSSNMYFYETIDSANWSIVTNGAMTSSSELIISHTYFTD